MRTKSISIILLISALIVSSSYSQQKTEWKGKIEYENGVKVIKNPKKPIYSEEVIDLEEELSIGDAEGQAEYIFGQIAAIAVDEKGHIYVADDEGRIYTLTMPVSQDEKSYLWDVFDMEGRYLAEIKLPGSLSHLVDRKNGILWKRGKLYTVEEDENGYHIVKCYKVTWNY